MFAVRFIIILKISMFTYIILLYCILRLKINDKFTCREVQYLEEQWGLASMKLMAGALMD